MDSKKLQALLVAVDTGSFTKAADILGYTQSGLTHMMNSLEKELGFQLLLRGHYGVKLTPDGEKIAPYIRKFVESEREFTDEIKKLSSNSHNHIKVGAYSSIVVNWLPEIVERFQNVFKDVSVEIICGGFNELYDSLYNGNIDMAFLSHRSGENVNWTHLSDDALIAILPKNYNYSGSTYPITSFDSQQFLMPYYGFATDIMKALNKYDVKPFIKSTFVDDASIIAMVQHNFGVSMLSELVMKDKMGLVNALPLDPPCYRELGIATLQKEQPYIIRKFIEFSVEYVNTLKKQAE